MTARQMQEAVQAEQDRYGNVVVLDNEMPEKDALLDGWKFTDPLIQVRVVGPSTYEEAVRRAREMGYPPPFEHESDSAFFLVVCE